MSLSINGKNWFYFLNNPGKANLLMSDDYSRIESPETFIVCWQIENKNYITEQQWTRVYTAFKDPSAFYDFYQNVKEQERCFYEIVLGSRNQKPHFDIDINTKTLPEGEDLISFCENLIKTISLEIRNNLCNSQSPKINVYTSHSSIKRSYHIIIENFYHKSNKEASAFYHQIVNKLPQTMKQYVDMSVYSPSQQFRLLGSTKFGSDRYKRTIDDVFDKQTFTNSLVSAVDLQRCVFVPLYEMTYDKNPQFIMDNLTFTQSVNDAKEVLKSYYKSFPLNYDCFSITSVKNNMILLKRERVALCPLCNRKHDHENAYLTMFNDKGYYHCRRMDREKFCFKLNKEPVKEYTSKCI
jgi:hypothetical protein